MEAQELAPDVVEALGGFFTRLWHSAAGYVFEAQPYEVAEDAEVLAALRSVEEDDRRHATLLANLLKHHGLVPEAGAFPWWFRDLNYLSVPYMAGFVLEELERDAGSYRRVLEAMAPDDLHVVRATLRTVLQEREERYTALRPLVAAAREREAHDYAEAIAKREAIREERLAREKAAAAAAREAARKAKAAEKAAAAPPAGDLPDPDEPGISAKEKARRTIMRQRAKKAAAPAAPDAGDLPDPDEPGISAKEKAKRTIMRQRAKKKSQE